MKDRFDIAFACDTDHDRHGIVTRSAGLLPPNHYLAVLIDYLFRAPAALAQRAAVGKTVVSSADDRSRGGKARPRRCTRCRWDSSGSSTVCATARSASPARKAPARPSCAATARVWTTDKDGIVPALLAAEITARTGRDPGEIYRATHARTRRACRAPRRGDGDAGSRSEQLAQLSPQQFRHAELAGETIERILDRAPGNDAPIGGLKVIDRQRLVRRASSGTEDIYKIYAESFRGEEHLDRIVEEAQAMVDAALAGDAVRESGGGVKSKTRRPVFFNLVQIQMPVGALTSITHRVTGILLAAWHSIQHLHP